MGVTERDPVAVEQAEEEAEDDLAVAVALGLLGSAHDLEALSLDVLGDQHATGREIHVDAGHARERVPSHQALDPALILGFELVVELLGDPLSQLREQRLRVHTGRESLEQRQQQRRVAQVGLDRLGDAGVLDLDDHVVAIDGGGPVYLADRGRGECPLVELGEHALERAAELLAHQFLELGEGDRRDVVAEGGQLAL